MTNPALHDMVKIGYATDVETRRQQLSTTAIAIISGSQDMLKRLKDVKKNTSTQIIRRPAINFYKCGLKDGDELVCTEDSSIVVVIKGERKVLYNNELTSLTAIMKKVKGYSNIAGPAYFTYMGESLTDIAERTQWKN